MAVKSSIHIKPCNISSSEAHNLRTPEYMRNIGESKIYLIPQLVADNEYWINPRLGDYDLQTHYDNIKQMVKSKTGRAMQEKERESRIGGEDGYWMNGLYEAFCIICIFPVIVSMGAGGKVTGKRSTAVCKFLGDISYPIYITHYPLVYTYTAWVCNNNATMAEGIPYMILTFVGAVVLAYACLKLYDEPVRRWLTDRFLKGKKK